MLIKVLFCFFIATNNFIEIFSKSIHGSKKLITAENEDYCLCGRTYPDKKPKARVFNGTKVVGYDWEWTVGLYDKNRKDIICTGSLISSNRVLTAAHCVDGKKVEDLLVLAGFVYNWQLMKNTTWGERNVTKYTKHPWYDHHKISVGFLYDLAIIELDKNFELGFNNSIFLACFLNNTLPDPYTKDYYFAGYGLTSPYLVIRNTNKAVTPIFNTLGLKQIHLKYDVKFCTSYGLWNSSLCLQNDQGSLCDGDSGGGIYVYDSKKRLAIVGIHVMLQSWDWDNNLNYRCYETAESVSVMLSVHLDFINSVGKPSCVLNNL